MKFHKKHWNSLLAVSFCCYWLFLILLFLFQNQTWTQTIRESKYTFWMFPTHYKMFTSPPKQDLIIHYHFYQGNQKIGEINANEYYSESLRNNKMNTKFWRNHSQYLLFIKTNSTALGNAYLKFLRLENISDFIDFEDYLRQNDRFNYQKLKNYFALIDEFQKANSKFNNANQVELIIERKQYHISKEYIDANGYDVATKKTIILKLKQSIE